MEFTFTDEDKKNLNILRARCKVAGLGDGIIRKIKEFIADGTIKKFEFIDTDEKTNTIELLEGVWGLGPRGAEKLYNKGIKTIE